jgi:SMI1/KNR4 family protein SUKH-1
MFDEIRNSFPDLPRYFSGDNQELVDELPSDYLEFLRVHNGGFVDEFRYTFMTGVPFKTAEVDNPSRDDCPVEFFGIAMGERDDSLPGDLIEIATEHAEQQFLPTGVIAITRCVQNSLVCLSIRPGDHGSIYYWDWYWSYPWCKPFFEARIAEALAAFEQPGAISENPSHPRYVDLYDALNFATLVKIASSFSEWFRGCRDRRHSK